MKWRGGRSAVVALAVWSAATTAALSCGFEDPQSAAVARGILNWTLPNSLHVGTAVWQARASGLIGGDRAPAAVSALLGYRKATERLSAFRDGLSRGLREHAVPPVSVVLLGPMLWARFERNDTTVDMAVHVSGPASGDTVIVTDEPVIAALVDGRLTMRDARDFGLLRVYGSAAPVAQLTDWLDRWQVGNANVAATAAH